MAGAGVRTPAPAAAGPVVEVEAELVRLLYGTDGSDGGRGFAVWAVRTQEGEARAAADLEPGAWGEPGDRVVLAGSWQDHPRHGRQLAVESVRPAPLRGTEGVVRWLARNRGLGERTAREVVDRLGTTALEQLLLDPELVWRLGLPPYRAEALQRAVAAYGEQRDKVPVLVWAHAHGFGPAQAEAIWRAFGKQAPAVLAANPWRLAELDGFGFLRADELARRLGVNPASPARLQAALGYALAQAAQEEGHVFLPERELLARTRGLLAKVADKVGYGERRLPPGALEAALAEAVSDSALTQEADRVYLPRLWRAEQRVRSWLAARRPPAGGLLDLAKAARLAEAAERRCGLDPVQAGAVTVALSMAAAVLTGGPGTGKTTTVRAVLWALEQLGRGDGALLAAPTGRAAKRLSEVTGQPAQTIHRLLDFGPLEGGGFGPRRTAEQPLAGDLLVVDEASMVDIELFADLVAAVPEDMPVLLVGDADQLPPVGPGAVFHTVVQAGLLPTVVLERIYRQGEGSAIPHAARLVNSGRAPEAGEAAGLYVRVYPRAPARLPRAQREEEGRKLRERMAADVVAQVQELLARHGFRPEEVQVLVPMRRRGALGVEELNLRLREVFNPGGRERGAFALGRREFWLGDRVMQTRNNYNKGEAGVFNGEQGVVVSTTAQVTVVDRWGNEATKPAMVVRFDSGEEVAYWAGDAGQLALAYALTVHKAQGSEYPAVVLALGWDAYLLLQRQLVYTGMTRAARRLVVLAEDGALQHAARAASAAQRWQWLAPSAPARCEREG